VGLSATCEVKQLVDDDVVPWIGFKVEQIDSLAFALGMPDQTPLPPGIEGPADARVTNAQPISWA
jgi:hypothetical protein